MANRRLIHFTGNLVLTLFGVVTALLMAEYAIKYRLLIKVPLTADGRFDYNEQYRLSALERGEAYDPRTLVELISSERQQKQRVFPTTSPAYFLSENGSSVVVDGKPVLPLGITALASSYYCNESGKFANFETDQYGFRNHSSAWSVQPEIVAIGDSFTMGSCLDDEHSLVGQIRKSGKQVLNLGMSSNGSLFELASLKEYALPAKPKIILWNFFANDLMDLLHEKNNPILMQYLREGFSQNLKQRAAHINPAVDQVVENYWSKLQESAKLKALPSSENPFYFSNIQKVYLYLKNQSGTPGPNYKEALELFLQIFSQASMEAKKNKVQLVFVNLPDCNDNSYGQQQWLPELLSSIKQFGIPVIDLTFAIDELKASGRSAYFSCPGSHFNATGAKIAAEQILQGLNQLSN